MARSRRASRGDQSLIEAAREKLDIVEGERLLAVARDASADTIVAVGSARLYAVGDGRSLAREWHLVDGGRWDHDNRTLTVTWVDGARPVQWVFAEATRFLAAFRERVQASVVLADTVDLGAGRTARLVIRKDLADGRLHDQAILSRGVRLADPGVADAVDAGRRRLREQVGLPI